MSTRKHTLTVIAIVVVGTAIAVVLGIAVFTSEDFSCQLGIASDNCPSDTENVIDESININGVAATSSYMEIDTTRVVRTTIVDTGQTACYNNTGQIDCPGEGLDFFGQDGNYTTNAFSFRDNGNGTISDDNTNLMWQQGHNEERLGYYAAANACDELSLGGYDDWRMPTIKELYSLIDFRGSVGQRDYIDNEHFALEYVDESFLADDPEPSHTPQMMGQTWSSTLYTGNLWGRNQEAAFFVNFLDGRIKSSETNRGELFYRCVRGKEYGENDYVKNDNATVTDKATGLVWQQTDDGLKREWQESLQYCDDLTLADFQDWRLPDAKELQSIVDYSQNDPAIDLGIFSQSHNDGWFWTGTTHGDDLSTAAYLCFGKCTAADGTDVHGAGAQRSDPKSGNPDQYSDGRGPQGDEIRITNYTRCVRGGNATLHTGSDGEGPVANPTPTAAPQELSQTNEDGQETIQIDQSPPLVAFPACIDHYTDEPCSFYAPTGEEIQGVCRLHGEDLACIPI